MLSLHPRHWHPALIIETGAEFAPWSLWVTQMYLWFLCLIAGTALQNLSCVLYWGSPGGGSSSKGEPVSSLTW